MNPCASVARALAEGSPLDATLRAHADVCDRCQALAGAGDALSELVNVGAPYDVPGLPPALRAAVEAEARAVAPFSVWRRAALPLGVVTLITLASLLARPRGDLAHQPGPPLVVSLLVLAGLVVAGVIASLHRGASGLGVPSSQRGVYLVGALVLAEAAVAAVSDAAAGSHVLAAGDLLRGAAHCALYGSVVATLVGAALLAVARRTAVTAPTSAGAAAGAAAGLAGTLFLHVVCPVAAPDHTMTSHVVPALLGAAVGALLGRRVLAV